MHHRRTRPSASVHRDYKLLRIIGTKSTTVSAQGQVVWLLCLAVVQELRSVKLMDVDWN